ncbi:hypothetical protein [Pedobacter sp. L105]|uniref:hypothetical protein n=1 Tax=Pedobacter sp. L105 TaxID=1641871 RepID=UPI00131AD209|nr:hypothetical protein [Pedobacter sp. L105]
MKNQRVYPVRNKTHIILFGAITDPGGGGGGGGTGGGGTGGGGTSPTSPGTGSGGGESTGDGSGGTLPHGTLSANDQYQVGTTFFAPPITSFVRFRYESSAALRPQWTVQTKALGDWVSRSGGSTPVAYATLDVPIDASNITVNITFQTSDSNGGSCIWQAMHT